MHACDVLVCVGELLLAHAAHYLVEQCVLKLFSGCLQQKLQFLMSIPGLMLRCVLFRWKWCLLCHGLGHRCFFLIARSARVTACSRLLLRSLIRLNSSQLILGVLSCSHACLRRLCFVSCVML